MEWLSDDWGTTPALLGGAPLAPDDAVLGAALECQASTPARANGLNRQSGPALPVSSPKACSEERSAQVPLLQLQRQPSFDLPVDPEHKATRIAIPSFAQPHMRAFHLSWFGFFTTVLSTFAPAAMIPIIRDALSLTGSDLSAAGIAAVAGTIVARVAMGTVCDILGPRLGMSAVLLLTAPFIFLMALAQDGLDFVLLRLGIGVGIATFVACQFWTSCMFNVKIVGLANATTGGWGNLGGGFAQFLMPLIFHGLTHYFEPFVAWRFAFFVPGYFHILAGFGILFFSHDLPDGNYAKLKKEGAMARDNGWKVALCAMANYRTWLLIITYGFNYGVELTMNNIIVTYLFDQFGISLTAAGLLGSLFGLMNLFSRAGGGLGSDLASRHYGMRGRLWMLWVLETLEGLLCLWMGYMQDSLTATIAVMIVFSIVLQASEGASFAVVPFVSKRSLGVVAGLVGAGGNAGSVITQYLFFSDPTKHTYSGLRSMGLMTMAVTLLVVPISFPMWGGMFQGPVEGVDEEDYYVGEYSKAEQREGLANLARRFAEQARSQRSQRGSFTTSQRGGPVSRCQSSTGSAIMEDGYRVPPSLSRPQLHMQETNL